MSLPNPVPRLAVLFVTLVLACPAIQVQATTIVQRDIREVAEGAALVVGADVVARIVVAPNPSAILRRSTSR